MHYYQHHIGDFIKGTSFLTNEEIGIYLKLIWLYYDTEKPLPNNLFELGMKTSTRDNEIALSGLLEMFFVFDEQNNCWHHNRCEKEIEHYKQQLNTASKAGKASALKRAMNKNSTGVEQSLNERSTSVQPTNNQEPLTNNHNSVSKDTGNKLPLTPDEIIFGYGVPLLTNAGTAERSARSFLGSLRKAHGDETVVNTLRDCIKAKPIQPLEWLAKALPPNGVKKNPADIIFTTVPGSTEPDPALLKIKEDDKKAVPPSLEVLAKMAELRKAKV